MISHLVRLDLALLGRLAGEREKQRFVSQQTPGAIALSKHFECEARRAFHKLGNSLTVFLDDADRVAKGAVPAHELRAIVLSGAADLQASLACTRRAQAASIAADERNQPAPWSTCRVALRRLLDQPDFARVDASLAARDDVSLPLGATLYALLVEILLRNAMDGCRNVAEPSIRLSARFTAGGQRHFETTVTDNGSGIQGTIAPQAFQCRIATDGEGRDNELFLLRSVVQECGGELNLSCEADKGTSVVMQLPFVAGSGFTESCAAPAVVVAPKSTKPLEIVVVDDDSVLASLTSQHIAAEGHSVTCFGDPRKAVESLLKRDRAPDLVICDIVMPDLSGYEVAGLVRQRFPAVGFVFVSGYISNPSYGTESDVFMTKPVSAVALLKCVKQLTRRES